MVLRWQIFVNDQEHILDIHDRKPNFISSTSNLNCIIWIQDANTTPPVQEEAKAEDPVVTTEASQPEEIKPEAPAENKEETKPEV